SQLSSPTNILLVSGGLNGALQEALKYPLQNIDYVELDPEIIRLVQKLSPGAADERVTMIAKDARRHIVSTADQYDAILIDLADPGTAQINRFYTLEFFKEARRALRPDGVLSFGLSGAENYANRELRLLSSTIYRSLQDVFNNILIIPGSRHYYLASAGPLDYDIARRLEQKGIPTLYVNDEYLQARLFSDRIALANDMVSSAAALNLDFRPVSYYGQLQYWLSKFQGSLLLPVVVACSIIIAIIVLIAQSPRMAPPLALSLTGFSAMGLEITILLAFQVIYGFVYQQLGIIITAFLLGTALGGYWSIRSRIAGQRLFLGLDICCSFFSFLLVPVLLILQTTASPLLLATAPVILFPCLTAVIGFLVGAQFPLAAKLTFHGLEKTAGAMYGLDFLGAALGALLISTFAIPLLGVIGTCYLIGGLKLVSTLVLLIKREEKAGFSEYESETEVSPRLIFLLVLLIFSGIGLLVFQNGTATSIYTISFYPPYHWLLLGLLLLGLLQAMQISPPYAAFRVWKNLDHEIFQRTKMRLNRWFYFFSFALLIFFPVFRCYFKIPYIFCHVCPRQCAFGYLRPYLVPAALIMNLDKRYWCFNCCPIGTFFDCQARVWSKPLRLTKSVKAVSITVLVFTAAAYFKISADLARPDVTTQDWYTFFFRNIFTPVPMVIGIALLLVFLAFRIRRSFCELLCPVGTLSDLILKAERLTSKNSITETEPK
ncbi:MAG: 4Fe-4S binding protein, partial [Desulfobulbales bacterium]|nr:4Fe-4S binding protein [Desulfobulbales bacterium]